VANASSTPKVFTMLSEGQQSAMDGRWEQRE